MAGMSTETGTERCSDGPLPAGPIAPAAEAAGWGACCWRSIATPMAIAPPAISAAPQARRREHETRPVGRAQG